MLSFLEVASLDAGNYILQLSFPKAHWTFTQKFQTCLSFDFVIEYYKRTVEASDYEIASVFPPSKKDLRTADILELKMVAKNKMMDYGEIVESLDKRFQVCRLYNLKDSKIVLAANSVGLARGGIKLEFNFNRDANRIETAIAAGKEGESNCFELRC